MSNHLAIGGVSLTLRALLEDRMDFAAPPTPPNQRVTVTVSPPDVAHPAAIGPRLNLFLYLVSENAFLKNQEIPGTGDLGSNGRPPLSLVLYYLVTTFSSVAQDDVIAQQVHGDAMRVLHDFPVVTDGLRLQRTPGNPPLLDPSLRGQFERMKITLHPANLEDISKIWTAIPQANLRLSSAYQVSVVQIESRRTRSAPLPVRERLVFALPMRTPQIVEVYREPGFPPPPPNPPFPVFPERQAVAESGDTLRIVGYNLLRTPTRVRTGTIDAAILSLQDRQIDLTVPIALQAGVHPVQVFHDLDIGRPPVPHSGFQSNISAFLLIPRIVLPLPAPAAAGALVTFNVQPAVLDSQQVELLLGDQVAAAVPRAPGTPPVNAVDFRLPAGANAIPAGVYLLRIRVDGAESRLTVDPGTWQFIGPTYQLL